MGEAKARTEDINATKARAMQEAQQRQAAAKFALIPAMFANGIFVANAGPSLVRVSFLDTPIPGNPTEVRATLIFHALDAKQIAEAILGAANNLLGAATINGGGSPAGEADVAATDKAAEAAKQPDPGVIDAATAETIQEPDTTEAAPGVPGPAAT